MSVDFYAGVLGADNTFGPVIPFAQHSDLIFASFAEDPLQEMEPRKNPDFVADASINVTVCSAHHLLDAMGFSMGSDGVADLPIDAVITAAERVGRVAFDPYTRGRVNEILRIARKGKSLGATVIVVA